MTIYQLECFIAVAEELNFSAAAQRLFTTQPAVTYQINTLEKETGLHLFDRTTRRTKLTAAGQSFYLDMVQMTSFGPGYPGCRPVPSGGGAAAAL